MSQRSLEYAFLAEMGMRPKTYIIHVRLHNARRILINSKSNSIKVTDAALQSGFKHFGEFSTKYKNCFDELPSDTLRKYIKHKL